MIVHDHRGQVIAFVSEKVHIPQSSDEVEALAAVKAISFALELGLHSVIIEGDSEVIIKALKSEEVSFASFGHLISAAKVSLVAFSSISFSHTHRLANSATHNLAKHAKYVSSYSVWMKSAPFHLIDVLLADFG